MDLAREQRAAKALVAALLDQSQPQPAREEAAESLAYSSNKQAIEPLISVLPEPDVRIRFWAVFALGGIAQRRSDRVVLRVIQALENMLDDEETPPGNWWSVGRESLAMLGKLHPKYAARLNSEIQQVMSDPNSQPQDLRWAGSYSY